MHIISHFISLYQLSAHYLALSAYYLALYALYTKVRTWGPTPTLARDLCVCVYPYPYPYPRDFGHAFPDLFGFEENEEEDGEESEEF